jgi:hypothetical protein
MTQYSVWTFNDDPGWVRQNGTREMALFGGQPLSTARQACQRLLMIAPESVFEIRDERGDTVTAFDIRPSIVAPQPERPARRPLGRRETKHA